MSGYCDDDDRTWGQKETDRRKQSEWLSSAKGRIDHLPAADAVPVVAYLYEDAHDGSRYVYTYENTACPLYPEPLIRQRDHFATASALQARINELESRQVPEGEVHFIQGGKLVGKIINVGSHPDTSKEQP